jgi:hypothetical protein
MPPERRAHSPTFDIRRRLAKANPKAAEIQPLEDGLLLEIEDPVAWARDNEPIFRTG